MKRQLLDILACPICKSSPLGLNVDDANDEEIVSGTLFCSGCGRVYFITNSIPNMIPSEK